MSSSGSSSGGSGAGGGGEDPAVDPDDYPVTVDVHVSREFVDYLNTQRKALGFGELAWSDALAAQCLVRAEEIADDYSHVSASGSNVNCDENLYTCLKYFDSLGDVTDSVEDWYAAWYQSDGHCRNMFDGSCDIAACAVYCTTRPVLSYWDDGTCHFDGYYVCDYYVVLLLSVTSDFQ